MNRFNAIAFTTVLSIYSSCPFIVKRAFAEVNTQSSTAVYEVLSPSGRYLARSYWVHDLKVGMTQHIVLHDKTQNDLISIDPNPGGAVSATIQIQFVAADNLIISWGCGTYCQSAPLFSPQGKLLTQLGIHSISPASDLAVTFASNSADRAVHLIDLRTGQILHSQPVTHEWFACGALWESDYVELEPCQNYMQQIQLPLQLDQSSRESSAKKSEGN